MFDFMRFRRNHLRAVTYIGLMFCSVFIMGIGLFSGLKPVEASLLNNQKGAPTTFAVLSGFGANKVVNFHIYGSEVEPLKGSAVTDDKGRLTLTTVEDLSAVNTPINYNIQIGAGAEKLDVTFRFDPTNGKMSVEGESADSFKDIELTTSSDLVKTKPDWAGLFEETGIDIRDGVSEKDSIELAFFNNNAASDIRNYQSLAVIKVVNAPGGGGVGPGGVNVWSPTSCGLYPLSTCNVGAVNAQNTNIVNNYVLPLQLMTEQLTVNAMHQITAIGMFFDAKEQMEAQRDHQRLKAQAVKDYHPSGGRRFDGSNNPGGYMCRVGSFMKGLAHTEFQVKKNEVSLNAAMMTSYQNTLDYGTAYGPEGDFENKLDQYKRTYCNPADLSLGLELLCDHDASGPGNPTGATDLRRANNDVDFGRVIEFTESLDIDFLDNNPTNDEQDVVALGRNLYWPIAMDDVNDELYDDNSQYYQRIRHLMALTNLAHTSYTKIVAMKAQAPEPQAAPYVPGWAHMKAMMREFGLTDTQIQEYYGERPGYHAQMGILTKRVYQNPDFYTNLYDKPANLDRIHATLEAIKMMQMRDHYEASLRREMLVSGMIEDELVKDAEILQGEFFRALKDF